MIDAPKTPSVRFPRARADRGRLVDFGRFPGNWTGTWQRGRSGMLEGVYPLCVPEVSDACPPRMLPTDGRTRTALAEPRPGPVARAGLVAVRRDRGRKRLPVEGHPSVAALFCHRARGAPVSAGMALRWGGPGAPGGEPAGGRGMLCRAAELGGGVVAGHRAAPGHRRHRAGRHGGGAERGGALSGQCDPGGLEGAASQSRGGLDPRDRDAAGAPGARRAGPLDGAGAARCGGCGVPASGSKSGPMAGIR